MKCDIILISYLDAADEILQWQMELLAFFYDADLKMY